MPAPTKPSVNTSGYEFIYTERGAYQKLVLHSLYGRFGGDTRQTSQRMLDLALLSREEYGNVVRADLLCCLKDRERLIDVVRD